MADIDEELSDEDLDLEVEVLSLGTVYGTTMVKFVPPGVRSENTGGAPRGRRALWRTQGTKAIKKEDDAPEMKKQKISIHVECTTADVADAAPRKPFCRSRFKGARPGQKIGAKQQQANTQRQKDEHDRSPKAKVLQPRNTIGHMMDKLRGGTVYSCLGCSQIIDPASDPKNLFFTQRRIITDLHANGVGPGLRNAF